LGIASRKLYFSQMRQRQVASDSPKREKKSGHTFL
jgi:hypothetical protein